MKKRLNHYDIRRRLPQRLASGRTFLIVTEGEKTEPNYLRALCRRLRLIQADVVIVHPNGTDPLTLVQRAMDLRDLRKSEAQRSQGVPYDEVWVVWDLEQVGNQTRRVQAEQAKKLKGARGIHFAESDPSFEYWLLLHFFLQTTPFANCDEVIEVLTHYLPHYSKKMKFHSDMFNRLPHAVHNAAEVRRYHQQKPGTGNPSTQVDQLVVGLNAATRLANQFRL